VPVSCSSVNLHAFCTSCSFNGQLAQSLLGVLSGPENASSLTDAPRPHSECRRPSCSQKAAARASSLYVGSHSIVHTKVYINTNLFLPRLSSTITFTEASYAHPKRGSPRSGSKSLFSGMSASSLDCSKSIFYDLTNQVFRFLRLFTHESNSCLIRSCRRMQPRRSSRTGSSYVLETFLSLMQYLVRWRLNLTSPLAAAPKPHSDCSRSRRRPKEAAASGHHPDAPAVPLFHTNPADAPAAAAAADSTRDDVSAAGGGSTAKYSADAGKALQTFTTMFAGFFKELGYCLVKAGVSGPHLNVFLGLMAGA
jgi:hypothetical protein